VKKDGLWSNPSIAAASRPSCAPMTHCPSRETRASAPANRTRIRPIMFLKQDAIGHHVRHLRKKAGLSVRALGARTAFSASFISQLENGLVSPSIGSMQKIAAASGDPGRVLHRGQRWGQRHHRPRQGPQSLS